MATAYYYAHTEDGDRVDDPSEDALFILIGRLDHADNKFMEISPPDHDAAWCASVFLLENGTYKVERRDDHENIHELTIEADCARVAADLTIWLAGRHYSH